MPGRTPTLILRSSAVLTSSYVASPAVSVQPNVTSGSFTVRYTSVEAISYPSVIIQMSDNGTDWSSLGIADGTLTTALGSSSTPMNEWVWNVFQGGIGAAATKTIDFITSVSQKSFMRAMCKENSVVTDHGILYVSFIGDVG